MKGNLNLGIELSHQSTNLNSIFPAITKQSYIGAQQLYDPTRSYPWAANLTLAPNSN